MKTCQERVTWERVGGTGEEGVTRSELPSEANHRILLIYIPRGGECAFDIVNTGGRQRAQCKHVWLG
jgi:hypothetical protein